MRFKEFITEAKSQVDDLEADEAPEVDAEQDDLPNIMIQLRKAVDVDGNYPIKFKDGSKAKLSMQDISSFVQKYMTLKPDEKESLQNQAISSLKDFKAAVAREFKKPDLPKIKGTRYMSDFGDEYPDTPDEGPVTLDNMSDREDYSKARDTLKVDPSPEFTPTKAGKGGKHKTNWDKNELPTKNKPESTKKGMKK